MKLLSMFFVLFCIIAPKIRGFHILIFHDMGTKSHLFQFAPLVEELLNRNNKVTGIFFSSLNIQHENYTEIIVPSPFFKMEKEMSKIVMAEGGQTIFNYKIWWWGIQMWNEMLEDAAVGALKDDKVEKLIHSGIHVDVVITLMPSGTFFAEHFDCPIIVFSPAGPISFFLLGTGNVVNLSVQPLMNAPYIEPMSFVERLQNHALSKLLDLWMAWIWRRIDESQRQTFGLETRHLSDIFKERFSIFLGCSHPVTHGSWPYLPNIIEVGGLHLKKPKILPPDLQSFMDMAHKGVVYVSFGSSLKPSQMSPEKLNMFVEAFKNIDMSIIWKWDEEVDNLPENVKTVSWVPQQDLLGHPNLKIFVTHGGLGSVVEAIYHKVVIVGIPFSGDQRPNLLRAQKNGYGKILSWDNLTAGQLIETIEEAMSDESLKNSLEEMHSLYVDRETRPVDKAAWWVEYVCRNKGAKMMVSGGEDIPWYQYHHVDIVLFLSFVFVSSIGVIVFLFVICFKWCCSKKTKVD